MADQADLCVYQGDDYAGTVTVTVDDGTPPDQILVGYTAQAQIRQGMADQYPNVAVEITVTIDSPYIFLWISHDDTVLLSGNQMRWDLQVTDPDGAVVTLLAGRVNVTSEVTRPVPPPLPLAGIGSRR